MPHSKSQAWARELKATVEAIVPLLAQLDAAIEADTALPLETIAALVSLNAKLDNLL